MASSVSNQPGQPQPPRLTVIVLRCENLEQSRGFYEALGFEFAEEKHGSGPVHLASISAGFTLELYPATRSQPVNPVRLGFSVNLPSERRNNVKVLRSYTYMGNLVTVVEDPDGRAIELSR